MSAAAAFSLTAFRSVVRVQRGQDHAIAIHPNHFQWNDAQGQIRIVFTEGNGWKGDSAEGISLETFKKPRQCLLFQ